MDGMKKKIENNSDVFNNIFQLRDFFCVHLFLLESLSPLFCYSGIIDPIRDINTDSTTTTAALRKVQFFAPPPNIQPEKKPPFVVNANKLLPDFMIIFFWRFFEFTSSSNE